MVFESFENIQLSLWWWTFFFFNQILLLLSWYFTTYMYSTHICYEVMNVCYKLSKTVYLEKQLMHTYHTYFYMWRQVCLNFFFIFIINGFCFISWFVFLYSTHKVSVTLKKGNAPSRTDREETGQVWHCPGRGDMYFSLGYNARLFGRFITLYFMLK